MTKTKLEAAVSLPAAGFRFEEVSGLTAAGRMVSRKEKRGPFIAGWFARLIKSVRHVRAEAEVRRCGHPGVLADYLSARSNMR